MESTGPLPELSNPRFLSLAGHRALVLASTKRCGVEDRAVHWLGVFGM